MPVATVHLSHVGHIGTLNAADKGRQYATSYEGHGLPVCRLGDLDTWEAIARLGGLPWWQLTKPGGGEFADYWAMTVTQRRRGWSQPRSFLGGVSRDRRSAGL